MSAECRPVVQDGDFASSRSWAVAVQGFEFSDSTSELMKAMALAQQHTGRALKNRKNTHTGQTYPDIGSVMDAVMPALNKAGILVMQAPVFLGTFTTKRIVKNKSGNNITHASIEVTGARYGVLTRFVLGDEWVQVAVAADCDGSDPQAIGSCVTYMRRYGLQTLGMVASNESDDDGNSARPTGQDPRRTPPPKPTPKKPTPSKTKKPDAKAERLAESKRKLLHDLRRFTDGDDEKARQVLRDCTGNERFAGFASVDAMREQWQVDGARKRFDELANPKPAADDRLEF